MVHKNPVKRLFEQKFNEIFQLSSTAAITCNNYAILEDF